MTAEERNEIIRIVERYLAARADPRMGRITSYDPQTHSVKVAVLPEADFPLNDGEDNSTGWIPFAPILAGNGTGVYAGPAIGTQVMLVHQENHAGSAVAIATINDQVNPPPVVSSNEVHAIDGSGSAIRMTNDNLVSHTAASSVRLNTPGARTSGNLVAGTGATGTFTSLTGQIITVQDGQVTNIYP